MDFQKLFEIFPYQMARYPQAKALSYKKGSTWHAYSTEECLQMINSVSTGLLNMGLQKGDKVAIMTRHGGPYWNFLDFGMQQIGVVVVPIHSTASPKELEYIVNDANIKYCFVSNSDLYQKIIALQGKGNSLEKIFSIEKNLDIPYWRDILMTPNQSQMDELDTIKNSIIEGDLVTIIYTSGTTGNPKGVMLSHKNIVSNIKAIISLVPVNYQKRTLSFLPMSHIFERMVTYTYMVVGASIYYADDLKNITQFMREVKPHYFTSVPRFLEKIYDSILSKSAEKGKMVEKLVHWAIGVGEAYQHKETLGMGYRFKLAMADLLVFKQWRGVLGGKVEGVVVGAAAMQANLGRLFSAAKIDIREGYGLTETSPVVSFNRFEPGGVRFGTVGIPIPGVNVKIDEPDEEGVGEILVQGPNVMLGYHGLPELTAKTIDEEGWLHTGDVGKIVHKKFLKITDRSKDIFKTSYGKYVAPQELENRLRESVYVEQSMIIGFQKPFVTALIVPNMTMLQKWADDNKVHWTAPQFMVINPKIEELMKTELDKINAALPKHKQIQSYHLLHEEWTIENEELTPTLKVKRPAILEHYQKEIAGMYNT